MTNTKVKHRTEKKSYTSYIEVKDIISQILYGDELTNILDVIAIHIERKLPKAQASILLFNEKENCLLVASSPTLPEAYSQAINGIGIGPSIGSCGTAAYLKEEVIVANTYTDPLWKDYVSLAKKYKLKACWSMPILNAKNELLGTFALYYKSVHKPTISENILLKELVDVVCLAIEIDRSRALKKQNDEEALVQRNNTFNSIKRASLGEMAKNMSHEINNPLAIMLASIHQMNRLLDSKNTDVDKLKSHAERLERSILRIEKVVSGLNSLTREASGDLIVQYNMRKLIDDTLIIFQERFISSNINIKLTGELDTELECRKTQISQVLAHLLNNSYEAISKAENPWILIHLQHNKETLRLEITDSGKGIPDSVVERIMIPMFTTKIHQKSSGLGLTVSESLVHDHGGKLWYDNTCQHTRFIVELPLRQSYTIKKAA